MARESVLDTNKIEKVLVEGFQNDVFSFFDIFSNCHVNLCRKNKMGEAVDTLKWIESMIVPKKKYDELNEEERKGKFPTGILLHDTNKVEYCKAYREVQEKAQAKKGGVR